MKIDKQIVVTEVDGELVYSYYPDKHIALELLDAIERVREAMLEPLETEGLTKSERKALYNKRYYQRNRCRLRKEQRARRKKAKERRAEKLAS